jgi:hypothetical protein
MKTLLTMLISLAFILTSQGQSDRGKDLPSKEGLDLIGVWKMDLSDQKTKLDIKEKTNLERMDEDTNRKLWKRTESWVYALDEEMNFVMTWVENGSLNELRGKWVFDPFRSLLELKTAEENIRYQVRFEGKRQVWTPITTSKEEFSTLYVKKIDL